MSVVNHSSTTLRTKRQLRSVLVVEDTKSSRVVNLDKSIYSLGRDAKNSIVIHSPLVSRYHATLLRVTNPVNNTSFFQIIDGDLQGTPSTNGLIINHKPCLVKILNHKDEIIVGGKAKAIFLLVDQNLSEPEILEFTQKVTSSNEFDTSETLIPEEFDSDLVSESALLRLASFPELLPSPIIEIDLSGKITYLNPAAIIKFTDIQRAEVKHPILSGLLDAIQNEKTEFLVREVAVGSAIFEESVYYIAESRLIRIYMVDITDRKRAEEALQESEERYALAAKAANDGLWDWNIKTNRIYFSSRWKSMLGFQENEISNSADEWFDRVHPDDIESLKLALAANLEGISSRFESEYRIIHKNRTSRWMQSVGITVKDAEGKIYRMVGAQTDITSRKLAEAQLLYDAFHDALTGLSNRALFMNRLEHAVQLSKRRQEYLFAVLFLDLDRFKVINDSLGHQSGDNLLIAFVERLVPCVHSGDTVARLGGDEFAILLEDIKSVDDAKEVANQIQRQLALPFNVNNQEVYTSVSIGIALSTCDYQKPEELIRNADIAMYRAKALGKARYQVFSPAMHIWAVTLLQLENDMRRAIERQEFVINYQPIVGLSSGRITGFEALIRWQHPERGLISPADFVPVAEETGLIVSIGYWILRQACRQLYTWQQRFPTSPPLTMSVNISTKQFREAKFVEKIQAILLDTGIEPSTLKLEITESVLMENSEATMAMLWQLKNLGINIYIDDFGTGYSSLSYLHKFPFDALKIDRSFISRMCIENESEEIVQTIINLARNLGAYIVAEGVETAEQQERLKQMDTAGGQGQGYYFSKPIASTAVEALLTQSPHWC